MNDVIELAPSASLQEIADRIKDPVWTLIGMGMPDAALALLAANATEANNAYRREMMGIEPGPVIAVEPVPANITEEAGACTSMLHVKATCPDAEVAGEISSDQWCGFCSRTVISEDTELTAKDPAPTPTGSFVYDITKAGKSNRRPPSPAEVFGRRTRTARAG